MIKDWLIDSGCSNHMTTFLDDIVNTPEPTDTVVEVANGHIVQATVTGTIHLQVMDINTHQVFDVYLENVLHVPGLSRRLFSVTQWTSSGGHISFGNTLCHISYQDPNDPKQHFKAAIQPPFTHCDASGHYINPQAAVGDADKKIPIPADLLH